MTISKSKWRIRDSKNHYKRVPRAKDSKITKIKDSLESLIPQVIPTYGGGNLLYDLRNIFGNGWCGSQPRGFNSKKMDPFLFLLLYHKICLQLAVIIEFRTIA